MARVIVLGSGVDRAMLGVLLAQASRALDAHEGRTVGGEVVIRQLPELPEPIMARTHFRGDPGHSKSPTQRRLARGWR